MGKPRIEDRDYGSVELARILGYTTQYLGLEARAGHIPGARQIGRVWILPGAGVRQWLAARPGLGGRWADVEWIAKAQANKPKAKSRR